MMAGKGIAAAPEGESDFAFVERIANGDSTAEHEFLRRFQPGVRALVRRHTRPNDPIVDDLVQDVLANVLERLRSGALRDAAALPAYVRSAVVFAARAEYRRGFRRSEGPLDEAGEIADSTADPAASLAAATTRELIKRLLDDLPVPRDREVLRRHFISEESKEAVCAALAIDEDHFRRVLHRAKQRLRSLLVAAGVRS